MLSLLKPSPPMKRSSMIESSVKQLTDLGINCLAVDFDLTLVDLHTGGRWNASAEELASHVRPPVRQLLSAAMDAGIHVAIVTFSAQVRLIREVLEVSLGDRAARIPIRGADRSWQYAGGGSQERKQPFIASAVEELEQGGAEITKATTLLIDDDRKNVRTALADGTRAIWLNPDKPHHLLRDIARLV